MNCPICSLESKKIQAIEWYISWKYYDIYRCKACDCHHMNMKDISKEDYEKIYKSWDGVIWYDRYRSYYDNIDQQPEPLKWLAKKEGTYSPIYRFFSAKEKKSDVLEIWCWLGYLTYAIQQLWNNCIWIDISKEAINKAQKKFKNSTFYYWDAFVEKSIIKDKKFDVIVATELIEHIDDFNLFFSSCNDYLKEWWTIILTTPNKWYYRKDALWIWDLPPVHTVWFHYNTFKKIGNMYNLDLSTYNYTLNSPFNLLIGKIYNNYISKAILSSPHQSSYVESIKTNRSLFSVLMSHILNAPIIRHLSNFICYKLFWISWSNFTLGIYLTKR